ncbi:uncharacterized protein si:ch211-67e16.4 isoform X2 [Centropristis striata]|uniref:uncharacterized protein si:ch211-67e16.4 isoform X2 n=1 Tax=Centropristis striata TaxID=184440 RepID=UPI0027E00347|nr:uncharacterized protein si:ch211-67e16.4 isoform X2 [Centropristis striata]
MDVSIAVSLIRGQMGAVVERAVNGAVETVLAEMLKVVGVKFEELKSQVALMKRDVTLLQREKAQKEKENDNIRAKLRYTELKLKYYRQGVEEELQQRASASTLVRIHPPGPLQSQRDAAGVSSTEMSPSYSTKSRSSEGQIRNSHERTSPHSTSRRDVRVHCHSDLGVASSDSSDLMLPVSLSVDTPSESLDSSTVLFCSAERDAAQKKEDDCEWTISLQTHTDGLDDACPPVQVLSLDQRQPSPDASAQADSSTLPSSAPQVKQEVQEQPEEEEEVICIKEEPEEEQEVMASLLLDCQLQQGHAPEAQVQRSVTESSGLLLSAACSSAGPNAYLLPQPVASLQSMVVQPSGVPPRQAVRPWNKDLSLYEEYKLRRNELRRRSINRRRELEKALPQPLLADLVRERREKTRLRVARWRAKRKLQACINQAQVLGDAACLSQPGLPLSSQQQQHRVAAGSACSGQQRQSSAPPLSSSFINNLSAALPFIPSSSSSSSSLLLGGSNMTSHQHAVTSSSSSSSSSFPQVNLLQSSISLTDADVLL